MNDVPAPLRIVGLAAGIIVWLAMMQRYKAYWTRQPERAATTQYLRWYARGAGAMVALSFFILSGLAASS